MSLPILLFLLRQALVTVELFPKKTLTRISPDIADRINAARLISVMLMMYVHVPSGQAVGNALAFVSSTRLDHWLESILIEGPGRASAALLSVVSGYLAATTLMRVGSKASALYRRRFFSIVVPMLCWAALTWAVYMLLGQRDAIAMNGASSWLDKLNVVFFLTDTPYGPTMHLGFLRDLFVCVLLSPLLLVALHRAPRLTMILLAALYLFAHSAQLVIILRPLVIFGFALGMLFALRETVMDKLDEYWPIFLFLTGVCAVLITWTNAGMFAPLQNYLATFGISLTETVLYPLCRLAGSLAIWCLLPQLMGPRLKWLMGRFSTYLFAAYCSHFLVLNILFRGLWEPLAGGRDSVIYLVWFLSAPAVAMVSAVVIVNVLARIYPPLARLVTGGRLKASEKTERRKATLATAS